MPADAAGRPPAPDSASPAPRRGIRRALFRWAPLILGTAIGLRETIAISAIGGLVAVGFIAASPLRHLREIPALAHVDQGSDPGATVIAPPTGA